MSSASNTKEQTLATERYEPALSGQYKDLFHALVEKMGNTLPSNRAEIIKTEMARVSAEETQNDVEVLRYLAALSVLVDLSLQGWVFDVHGNELTLKMETDNVDDKQRMRYRLSAERNAQFNSESVSAFIKQMETIKNYKGTDISVRNLIGDKNQLLAFIRAGERVCDPYIQIVTNKRDDFTGYKLSDIWRYFRYTWSIPYKTMPGRNLFYLVRDRLQPYHPVLCYRYGGKSKTKWIPTGLPIKGNKKIAENMLYEARRSFIMPESVTELTKVCRYAFRRLYDVVAFDSKAYDKAKDLFIIRGNNQ